MLNSIFLLIISVLLIKLNSSTFSPDFENYLLNNYGLTFEKAMSRNDMGIGLMGSFGGKLSSNQTIKNQPVIFVHGVTLRAGVFIGHVQYFHTQGYNMAELYATTYGDGGKTTMFNKKMTCDDVKQIRDFIKVVHEYTNSSVDIISYSMGCAISRKAILGGKCVDTNEDLGEPLTNIVDTFVAIGGVVYGVEQCHERFEACNIVNGMICGSNYLKDVNSVNHRYEGKYSFSLYSVDDRVVGQRCCGNQCSELDYSTNNSIHKLHDHGTILIYTKDIQLKMIREHKI